VNTYESTTVFLAILQLLISGLGFVVVAWTLRVLVRQIDAQSSAGVATRQLEFDKVILEHPCLYRYFYQDQDIAPDDPEYNPRHGGDPVACELLRRLLSARGDVSADVA
jgi:hypothetical protein